MKKRSGLVLSIALLIVFISAGSALSQETITSGGAIPDTENEPEIQWVWGEVISVDSAAKTITVRYLDYETDQEKEIAVGVDDKTTYENIKSLDEVKPKDTLSIDYILSADGKNLAKNISAEKPESAIAPIEEAAPVVAEEAVPEGPDVNADTEQ